MPLSKQPKIPTFRVHKASQQGYVELNGQRIYLGRFDLPESKKKYHQLIAEWLASGRNLPVEKNEITILEVVARFWTFAESYYRTPDGRPSDSLANFKSTIRELKTLYGDTKASEFGPRALKALREKFVQQGHCRKHINKMVSRVKQIIRWAVSEELIPSATIHGLDAVLGLKRGRSTAPESVPVRPVPAVHIAAIQNFVSRQIWAMIQMQLFTAARPGEIVIMRPVDLDTTGITWLYRPITHKTAYRELPRTVYIGPRAKEILLPFLQDRAIVDFIFSPREADTERRAVLHAARTTPLSCGNVPGSNRNDKAIHKPGLHYTTNTYRRAVERACKDANVPLWTPGQLRHNAATLVRREFGLEAAQLLLGHARADVTQLYAEVNELKAISIVERIG